MGSLRSAGALVQVKKQALCRGDAAVPQTVGAGYPRPMIRTTLSELVSKAGVEIGVSDWFEVTQTVIDEFAHATRDLQWIHIDTQRSARESPFKTDDGVGCTVAHGFLTLSLLPQWMDGTIVIVDRAAGINAGFNKVRFSGPVLVGSRIRARFALASAAPIKGGAKLLWNVNVEREGQARPVLIAEWLTRVLTAAGSDQRAARSPRRHR